MITRKVKVDTIEKVKNFTNEIGKFEASADLGSIDRRYTVDAKSILGVFSFRRIYEYICRVTYSR